MELGAFSISLAVKDIEASRVFYEKFGFTVFGGIVGAWGRYGSPNVLDIRSQPIISAVMLYGISFESHTCRKLSP